MKGFEERRGWPCDEWPRGVTGKSEAKALRWEEAW